MAGLPSWIIAIILAVAFELAMVAGWRLYRRLWRGRGEEGASAGLGYVVSGSLGLLSLLIGFTLAMSLDRYEMRRALVVVEANAISTVWLRDQVLDQPSRGRVQALLREYVKEREALPAVGAGSAALDAEDRRTEALQASIWRETLAGLRSSDVLPFDTVVIQATNHMFDEPAERRAALDADVPSPVLWVLVVVGLITAALTGYGLASGRHRHRFASAGLFVAAALAITLIFELDEPWTGLIQVSQAPLDRVAASILSAPSGGN
ncbi:MAG TPA: hypothetical protein VK801_11505 [Caulobacteraceae bacterium]|jgi:hypothetical protein|nr:hypothetical protein [Caulobacteraceae bacterium]